MRYRIPRKCSVRPSVILTALLLALAAQAGAQTGAGVLDGPSTRPRVQSTPKSAAPVDLTGYWVSVVTEDWRFRMMVPDKGDYQSVPMNPEGIKVADAWDPEKDQASGNQCKSYGAPAIMRVPGRLHLSWENDTTLRIDTDSGTQTRLLHFGEAPPATVAPQWQGFSVASWEGLAADAGPVPKGAPGERHAGYLKVMTSHLKPGYLRKNGVPYSANATLEEYYDSFKEINGDVWLIVTTIVTDPQYLAQPFVTSSNFKKLPGASGWDPTPCRTNEPR
jgi:hypothetical protein